MGMLLLFILQLGTMIFCITNQKTKFWICQLLFQAACILYSGALLHYFNNRPIPDGLKAPGLYNLSEVLTYLCSTAAFFCLFAISLCVVIWRWISWNIRK